jgi:signal transduction histidine kinase
MRDFHRSLVFRNTLVFVALFVAVETIGFALLYWSTVAAYERRQNREIQAEFELLVGTVTDGGVDRLAAVITARASDEPGENDEYLLATEDFEYIAGNVRVWPRDAAVTAGLVDLELGQAKEVEDELHRVRLHVLPSGHRLLVGRNLTELARFRERIAKAFLRTVGLTVLLGFGGGYLVSRSLAGRLNRINRTSMAVLTGDISQRVKRTESGDEIDVLSGNLNQMLDRIEDLVRGMREVSDNIAHDLRQPISRLRSRIELALMRPQQAESYREVLAETLVELDGVLTVFNALLTIAIAESGAAREFEESDLAQIARSAVELYEPAAEDAGLKLELQAPRPVPLRGNPHLITQALTNLIDNAIKYASESGTLAVAVRGEGQFAVLTVTDRGPGIPESFRKHAFDRFARLEPSRSTPGSGLGLSLVRAVAQLHGGSVRLADARPGLEVTLRFPQESS